MSTLKIGALFAGYGGLDMAVMDVLDAELAWYAEFDKAPAKVMAHHHPDVPNLWDVTKVDWSAVEPVDIITGGSPCQDLSHAGKRKGMKAGTRSGLWASMFDAVDIIRPRLVVWENVRGALNAEATSEMEQCPGCLGGGGDGAVLRALGRVLGDLADIGYDARWYGLRAADVGGAHGRFRVFVVAAPADSAGSGRTALGHERIEPSRAGQADATGSRRWDADAGIRLLPTPQADTSTTVQHGKPALQAIAIEHAQDWRQYERAIRRAERATGRPAPDPIEAGPRGPRLSAAFSEWLMMLPPGHVTDPSIGITYKGQLKALGNGVVPPQAAAALRAYLRDESEAVA